MTLSSREQNQEWLSSLQEAADRLQSLPEADGWRTDLINLERRLAANQHLVAVFGAFSAGKSSLINALLGDSLLIVSPNPTTAAVTHVERADESVRLAAEAELSGLPVAYVRAKSTEQVWDDIRQTLESLHLPVTHLDEAIALSASLKPSEFTATARKAVSFLRSAAAGYDAMKSRLGTTWLVAGDELAKLTTQEQYASYVDDVRILHSATVLSEGLSLVDTPGVDSIHRRHTDVAFKYMRKADAIVFVLYYTHAFSRADKDFLLQLAGVQDVQNSDKLLVVINAVDLAKSPEEQTTVRERVITELRQLGIRKGRVFEVSSQTGFAAEQLLQGSTEPRLEALLRQRLRCGEGQSLPSAEDILHQSGIPQFRQALIQQVTHRSHELSESAAMQALLETKRKLENLWRITVERQRQDAGAAQTLRQARQRYLAEQATVVQVMGEGASPIEQELRAEWSELVFHAGERIRMRFGGLVRESFHPGRFRFPSSRTALSEAGEELLATLTRQIELECRTFSLRAEAQAQQAMARWGETVGAELTQLQVPFDLPAETDEEVPSLAERTYRARLEPRLLATTHRHFSSPKQFFEEGGQQSMQRELESSAMPFVRDELKRLSAEIESQRLGVVQAAQRMVLERAVASVNALLAHDSSALSKQELARWTDVVDWFQQLLETS